MDVGDFHAPVVGVATPPRGDEEIVKPGGLAAVF
jgi:hypothetical protein